MPDREEKIEILRNEFIPLLRCSIFKLFSENPLIFETLTGNNFKGMEQSAAFRIGFYLQKLIDENKVFQVNNDILIDMEYNKLGENTKTIGGGSIRPDLIIHKRGCSLNNMIAIEFKYEKCITKEIKARKYYEDFRKLKYLTKDNEYNYLMGFFVLLQPNGYHLIRFENGEKIAEGSGFTPLS